MGSRFVDCGLRPRQACTRPCLRLGNMATLTSVLVLGPAGGFGKFLIAELVHRKELSKTRTYVLLALGYEGLLLGQKQTEKL